MREPRLGPCHITGRTSARQSLFLDDLMPVWARFSFVFSNSTRARCLWPFFEFPFDIDILALSLDLHDCGFAARQFVNRRAQLLHANNRFTVH